MHLNHDRLFQLAALFTWLAVGIPLYLFLLSGEPFVAGDYWWAGGHLLFGVAYGLAVRHGEARFDWPTAVLFAAMTGSALMASYGSGTGLGGILLMVIAALLAWHRFPAQVVVVWLIAQNAALAVVFAQVREISMQEAATYFMRTTMAIGSKWGTRAAERARSDRHEPVAGARRGRTRDASNQARVAGPIGRRFSKILQCSTAGRTLRAAYSAARQQVINERMTRFVL